MKSILKSVPIFFLLLFLVGCEVAQKVRTAELENRGGIVDKAADEVLIANSKGMRTLRAYAVTAAISGLALETGLGEVDRQAVAAQLVTTMNFLEKSKMCAEDVQCVYFDTRIFDVNKSVFALAKTILPTEDIKEATRLTELGVSTIRSLLDLGRRALKGGLRVAAIYRDTWELFMIVYGDYLEAGKENDKYLDKADFSDAYEKWQQVYLNGNGDIELWKKLVSDFNKNKKLNKKSNKVIDVKDKDKFELISYAIEPNNTHYQAVITVIGENCKSLASEAIEGLCDFKKHYAK